MIMKIKTILAIFIFVLASCVMGCTEKPISGTLNTSSVNTPAPATFEERNNNFESTSYNVPDESIFEYSNTPNVEASVKDVTLSEDGTVIFR